jgi:hypothetical protein
MFVTMHLLNPLFMHNYVFVSEKTRMWRPGSAFSRYPCTHSISHGFFDSRSEGF